MGNEKKIAISCKQKTRRKLKLGVPQIKKKLQNKFVRETKHQIVTLKALCKPKQETIFNRLSPSQDFLNLKRLLDLTIKSTSLLFLDLMSS